MRPDRTVLIGEKEYRFTYSWSDNRRATAKLRDDTVHIRVPKWWPAHEMEKTIASLERRAIRGIESGRWHPGDMKIIKFTEGQQVKVLGRDFVLQRGKGKSTKVKRTEYFTVIEVGEGRDFSESIRRAITKEMQPLVERRVLVYNDAYFHAMVKRVGLRDAVSRWGSCSHDGAVSLNFRLLFAPEEILDYVIVHELGHTKYKSHGKRFWGLIDRIMPDYRQREKWLKEKGHLIDTAGKRLEYSY